MDLTKSEWILISEALKVATKTYSETATLFPVGSQSNAKRVLIESAWGSRALQKKVLEIIYLKSTSPSA